MNRLSWVITCAALIGITLSALSLNNHYETSETEYCDFGNIFNCDVVNRGIYSEIGGLPVVEAAAGQFGIRESNAYSRIGKIPVAAVGVVGYLTVLVLSRLWRHGRTFRAVMLVGSLGGLGLALYLTYIEAYLLGTWCILCVGSQVMIAIIAIFAAIMVFKRPPKDAVRAAL